MTTAELVKICWQILKDRLRQKKFRRVAYAILFGAGTLFISYALYKNWNDIKAQDIHFDYRYVLLAILIYPAGMLPTVAAWHTLLRSMGISLKFRTNLKIYSLTSLPRHIPGFVWYVTSRALLYQEEGIPGAATTAATGAEVMLLALTGFTLSIPMLVASSAGYKLLYSGHFMVLAAVFLLVVIVAFTSTLNRLLERLFMWQHIQPVPQIESRILSLTLVWMFIAWVGGGLILFLLATAIYPPNWTLFPKFVAMWGLAGAVSLTIGIGIQGFGIREITLSAMLSLLIPPIIAVVLAVAFRLVLIVGELIWVILFVWITKKYPGKPRSTL